MVTITIDESTLIHVGFALSILFNVIFWGVYMEARWDIKQLETECKFWEDWKNNEQERYMKVSKELGELKEKQAKKQEETDEE